MDELGAGVQRAPAERSTRHEEDDRDSRSRFRAELFDTGRRGSLWSGCTGISRELTSPPTSARIPPRADDRARALAQTLSISVPAAAVLTRRGHAEGAERFLDPKLAHLTPPTSMIDRAEAVDRIARAVRTTE